MLLISAEVVDSAFFWSLFFKCVPSMAPAMFGRSDNSSKVAMEALVSASLVGNLMKSFLKS